MRLSRRIIPKLAQMICGAHGSSAGFEWPNFPYRSSWYLTQFFYEDCRLPYKHDGSTRITWVTNVLTELNEGKASYPDLPADDLITVIQELLMSVVLEHPEKHEAALADINNLLAVDNIHIRYEEGQYVFSGNSKTKRLIRPSVLKTAFEDFAQYIAANMRMSFWNWDKVSAKYKWIPSPEQHAKNLLLTFLNGKFGASLYTFDEIKAGAGKIDIFIALPEGEKVIVELKMCGHNYSLSYAAEGLEQLIHYMRNRDTDIGYLIIFDSRVRDFAQGFQANEPIDGFSISVSFLDLRPYVKLKDAPSDV